MEEKHKQREIRIYFIHHIEKKFYLEFDFTSNLHSQYEKSKKETKKNRMNISLKCHQICYRCAVVSSVISRFQFTSNFVWITHLETYKIT